MEDSVEDNVKDNVKDNEDSVENNKHGRVSNDYLHTLIHTSHIFDILRYDDGC